MIRYSFPKRGGPESERAMEKQVLGSSVDSSIWTCSEEKGSCRAFLSEVTRNARQRIWSWECGRAGKRWEDGDRMSAVRCSKSSMNVWWECLHLFFRYAPWKFSLGRFKGPYVQNNRWAKISFRPTTTLSNVPLEDESCDGSLNTHTAPERVVHLQPDVFVTQPYISLKSWVHANG